MDTKNLITKHIIANVGNIHRSPTRNDCDFIIDDNTESTGGGKAHNNMPPYLVTNCWRRIN